MACPECGSREIVVTATVSAGQWERHFCQCPACDLSFPDSWHQLTESVPVAVHRRQSSIMLLAAAV
jgi:transcription elongation factor Elf1